MSSAETDAGYSYRDYLSWPEGERVELIDGVAFAMSPAPRREHQRLLSELNRQVANAIRAADTPCEVYPAPFDVRLGAETEDEPATVVQPDLSVICDPARLTERGARGAPDLVVEIVSPDSGFHDRGRKFDLYRRFGVREYWIVDPDERVVEVYANRDDEGGALERLGVYGPDDTIRSRAVPVVVVELREAFRR